MATTDELPSKARTLTGETSAPASRQAGVLARNAFHLLLGQIASTVLSVAFSAVLGRQLGAADFGVYFLLMSMSTFAYVAVDWGQSYYVIREVARRPEEAGGLLGSSLILRSVSGAVAVILTALAARLLGYEMKTQHLAGLTVACALPLALSQPYGYLFRGRDRMDLDATVSVTAKALTVALAISALLLGGHLPAVILIQGLAGVGALGVAMLLARRIHMPSPSPSRESVRKLVVGGTSIAVFYLVASAEPYIAAIVLSKLAPASAMGWYAAARNIIGVLIAPATILATANFPELSRVASDPAELRHAIRRSLRPLLGLGALGAVGTYLFADFAVTLIYGKGHFDPAAQVLQLFAPALLPFFVGILMGAVITAVGRTRELALVKLICVALNTGLAVLLVPYFQARFQNGGMGLVLAFGSTEIVMIVACVYLAPPGVFALATLSDLVRALAAGGATLAVLWWLPPVTPWLMLPMSILVFALFSLATGLFRWTEVSRQLASALRST